MRSSLVSKKKHRVTGLVLAGGLGRRMGQSDKGLQTLNGQKLVEHALSRLSPQVTRIIINANRNLHTYQQFGYPVIADQIPEFQGPLAGILSGLNHCQTEWMITVPCDVPKLPADLVTRLLQAAEQHQSPITMPVTTQQGRQQTQPVFLLIHHSLGNSLTNYLANKERKIDRWVYSLPYVQVQFPDSSAFDNINTFAELDQMTEKNRKL